MTDLCFEKNAEEVCEECLVKSIKEDPDENNLNYLQTVANLRMVQQKTDVAKQYMSKCFNLIQNGAKASYEFKISVAKILIELAEYSSAIEILLQLTEDFDQIVDVWYLLGLCLKLQKEFKSAIEHFNKGLEVAKATDEDPEFVKVLKNEIKECSKEKIDEEEEEEDDDDYITDDDLDIMEEEIEE
jgi:tetratricopeptide (TPR) repeat protein